MSLSMQNLPPGLWRASELAQGQGPVRATGFVELDQELPGGGWPAGALAELLPTHAGIGELRLLLPALATLTRVGKPVVMIAPPYLPYAPALAGAGVDLRHLVLVHARAPSGATAPPAADDLWAAEQALKSASCGAVLAWLPQARADQLRRLQLAAAGSDALAWVVRQPQALASSSPAPLRLALEPAPGSGLLIHFHKRRGPARGMPLRLDLPAHHPKLGPPRSDTVLSPDSGGLYALLDCTALALAHPRGLSTDLAA
ncbi:hypothetical protein PATSB16_28720 [Pandoraea thiooxydans]|uniref:Translesion DNA synthesis-associated protein ImuA n=2 Tax=Pandoraea thiooxydans TaxID=445709 RepID=A0A0U4EL62_9BURK|nr:hypothetical protein ABW99_11575 [Pandoraea thiooxydans]APR96212.1 hypothetical protein PATSB16_28720 [Pandoraea thiooxydans]